MNNDLIRSKSKNRLGPNITMLLLYKAHWHKSSCTFKLKVKSHKCLNMCGLANKWLRLDTIKMFSKNKKLCILELLMASIEYCVLPHTNFI